MKRTRTSSRKQDHVAITLAHDVAFRERTAGFERWDLPHDALPEIDLEEVDPSSTFLGKYVAVPLLVSSMTGGYREAQRINRNLAEVCADRRIAMGVGSQRQALESDEFHRTFSVVREAAPDIPVFGNIGAAEVAAMKDPAPIQRLADLIHADGFAVHLNPLQEFLQPEGAPRFRGVLQGIERLVRALPVPVIVKEIGSGISADVARRLTSVGVRIIDVAGAGGTSWAGVELVRRKRLRKSRADAPDPAARFWDWGIPTSEAIQEVAGLRGSVPDLRVIASGGIRNGIDAAKAIAMGADWIGVARIVLQTLESRGVRGLHALLTTWETELRGAMFLTGSRTLAELRTRVLRARPA